ncbi:alpha/beta hydrolase [Streptomyces lavendulocolor]|uniref:alpha/beta fold hydrolase n=1 Tax=Streptomyces lavendulocolor TaxID=67316 RepID=UPI0033DF9782
MVCVHGAGVSSREFRPFIQILGGRQDAWTVDLPGFGASGGPPHPLNLHALADALAEWLTTVAPDKVVLLGGSFGCQVAVDTAVRHPDRIAGLVLVGPTVDPAARGFTRRTTTRRLPRRVSYAMRKEGGLRRSPTGCPPRIRIRMLLTASAARPVRRRATTGGRQTADVAEGGCLFPESRDLVMLGSELRDGGGLERGEFGEGFVPLGDPIFELVDLGLEPFARGSTISPACCSAVRRRSNSSARCW